MPAASSGARSPLCVAGADGRHAKAPSEILRREASRHCADSPGVIACRAATVTSGVNPPEQRPSVSEARTGAAHGRAGGDDGADARRVCGRDARRPQECLSEGEPVPSANPESTSHSSRRRCRRPHIPKSLWNQGSDRMRHYADGNYSYRLAAHYHGVGKTVRRAFVRWSSAAPAVRGVRPLRTLELSVERGGAKEFDA